MFLQKYPDTGSGPPYDSKPEPGAHWWDYWIKWWTWLDWWEFWEWWEELWD